MTCCVLTGAGLGETGERAAGESLSGAGRVDDEAEGGDRPAEQGENATVLW